MRTIERCLVEHEYGLTTSYDPDRKEIILGSELTEQTIREPIETFVLTEITWQQEMDAFFERNKDNLVRDGRKENEDEPYAFIWDDNRDVRKYLEKHFPNEGNLHCYTITEEDGEAYIQSGYRWVNRIMWLISKTEIEPGICIRYW